MIDPRSPLHPGFTDIIPPRPELPEEIYNSETIIAPNPEPRQDLTEDMSNPGTATVASTGVEMKDEYKGKIDQFTGERDKYKDFVTSLRLHFTLNSKKYDTDAKKIMFTLMNMGGDVASSWRNNYIEGIIATDGTIRPTDTFVNFMTALDTAYKSGTLEEEAKRKVHQLKQENTPATEFITKF